jgi:hypothetical protein
MQAADQAPFQTTLALTPYQIASARRYLSKPANHAPRIPPRRPYGYSALHRHELEPRQRRAGEQARDLPAVAPRDDRPGRW